MMYSVLWMCLYHCREGLDLKEDIKAYAENTKFNVKNTVRDIDMMLKMMFERVYTQFNSHQLTC